MTNTKKTHVVPTWQYMRDNWRLLVACHCPKCSYLMGEWPEGGLVKPDGLWRGTLRCPICGYVPEGKP